MALTRKEYTGNGSTTLYNVDFDLGYIDKDYVYVYLADKSIEDQLSYTWRNDNQIELSTPVASGVKFYIRRVIPRAELVNDYEDGAILREGNLNDSYLQTLMILEEVQDGFITVDDDFLILAKIVISQNLDMKGFNIENLGEASSDSEATPLSQVNKLIKAASDLDGYTAELIDYITLKIFQSPTDGGLTEIQTRTVNASEVYEVRKTSDDSLATIYSDAAGTTEIVQNGTSNVYDTAGVVVFYIADGDYKITSGGVDQDLKVGFVAGKMALKTPLTEPTTHALMQNVEQGATRVHIEPNGFIDEGVTSKLDLMGQPYDIDSVNYNIWNLYVQNGDPFATGEGTVIAFNAKGVGNNWGLWPSINFGFQDLGENAVCAKMWYGDHSQPEHFTPNKGNWREGKVFAVGDYATNNNDVFRASTAGVAGNTPPIHTSGTVSDGSVDWEFIYSPDYRTVRATYMFGDRNDMPVLGHSDCRAQFKKNYLTSWGTQSKWTNSNDDLIFRFRGAATNGGVNEWMHLETGGGGYLRFSADGNYMQTIDLAITEQAKTYTAAETSIDLSGTTLVNFGNTVATTVTTVTNMKPNQVVKFVASNNNTTIQDGASIKLIGGVDITLSERTAITFISDISGTFLKQIGNEGYQISSVSVSYNDTWQALSGASSNNLQCAVDRGVVYLSGNVEPNGSASTQIGTLPVGYRPVDRGIYFLTCDSTGAVIKIDISTGGAITTSSISGGISFDNVSFVINR